MLPLRVASDAMGFILVGIVALAPPPPVGLSFAMNINLLRYGLKVLGVYAKLVSTEVIDDKVTMIALEHKV